MLDGIERAPLDGFWADVSFLDRGAFWSDVRHDSFIWQPCVWMKSFFVGFSVGACAAGVSGEVGWAMCVPDVLAGLAK